MSDKEDLEEKISRVKSDTKRKIFPFIGRVIFLITLVVVILFDAYIFQDMNNWSGPLAIAALEWLALVIIGKTMGVVEPMIFFHIFRGYIERNKR